MSKNWKKMLIIILVNIVFFAILTYISNSKVITSFHLSLLGDILIQDIPLLLIFVLLNYYYLHQKIIWHFLNWTDIRLNWFFILFFITGFLAAIPTKTPAKNFLSAFIITLVVAITEEYLHRGLILPLMAQLLHQQNAFFITLLDGILFGLFHAVNFSSNPSIDGVLNQMLQTTAMGFLFAVIYLRTNNFLAPVLSHFLLDYVGIATQGNKITTSATTNYSASLMVAAVHLIIGLVYLKKIHNHYDWQTQ